MRGKKNAGKKTHTKHQFRMKKNAKKTKKNRVCVPPKTTGGRGGPRKRGVRTFNHPLLSSFGPRIVLPPCIAFEVPNGDTPCCFLVAFGCIFMPLLRQNRTQNSKPLAKAMLRCRGTALGVARFATNHVGRDANGPIRWRYCGDELSQFLGKWPRPALFLIPASKLSLEIFATRVELSPPECPKIVVLLS